MITKIVASYVTALTIFSLPNFDYFLIKDSPLASLAFNSKQNSDQRKLDSYLTQTYDTRSVDGNLKVITISQGFGTMKNQEPARRDGDRTGAYLWRGGVEFINVLSRMVTFKDLEIDLLGKHVIDIGTGTGVVGIQAILQGANEVLLTDGSDEIVRLAAFNVHNNFPSFVPSKQSDRSMIIDGYIGKGLRKQHIGVAKLRWGNDEDIKKALSWIRFSTNKMEDKYDYIVASEVFYKREIFDKLLNTMKMLVKPQSEGGKILLRLTKELTDDAQGFDYLITKFKDYGFQYKFFDSSQRIISKSNDVLHIINEDSDDYMDDSSQLIVLYLK